MIEAGYRLLKPLERWGTALENALLVLLLGAMILLATTQIVLRIGFDQGLIWADELLKILVLWVALIGSVATSRGRRHLRIDILSHYVPERFARVPVLIVDAFAALVCGLIAWHSARYVLLTIEFGDTVLVDVPAWAVQGVLPVAFALMAYRFALYCLKELLELLRRAPVETAP
ncbi:MAG TPA: TRAP transporter small permease [Woeseiaceae bacterium]|nr:TRAP transporter small permease [Woeseiaceae bacterium]